MPSASKMQRKRAARQRQAAQMENLAKGAQEQAQQEGAQGPNPNDPKGQIMSSSSQLNVRIVSSGGQKFANPTRGVGNNFVKRVEQGTTKQGFVRKVGGTNHPSVRRGAATMGGNRGQVQRHGPPNPAIAQQSYGAANRTAPPAAPQVPAELVKEQTFSPSHVPAPPQAAPSPAQRHADVTVIITTFERPGFLKRQLQALHAQTLPPAHTVIWANAGEVAQDGRMFGGLQGTIIRSNANHGAWPRFREALSVPTSFVCLLDDDTIPGPQWLEAALHRIQIAEQDEDGGTLCVAAAGEVFRSDNPDDTFYVGPPRPRDDEMEVDIGRQGWVLRRELLRHTVAMPHPGDGRTGWDFHLAVTLQMQDVLTVVLPYAQGNTQAWGMLEPATNDRSLSAKLQIEATQGGQDMAFRRRELYSAYRQAGWAPLVVLDAEEIEAEAGQNDGTST